MPSQELFGHDPEKPNAVRVPYYYQCNLPGDQLDDDPCIHIACHHTDLSRLRHNVIAYHCTDWSGGTWRNVSCVCLSNPLYDCYCRVRCHAVAGVCTCCKRVGKELDPVQPPLHRMGVPQGLSADRRMPEPMHTSGQVLHPRPRWRYGEWLLWC